MAITQAQMRMLRRRRTSDIERLAQQYKRNVEAMTGEFQTAFGEYQGRVAEQMKPFEEQLAKYKAADMPAYEAAKAQYEQQLDAYTQKLKELEADPVVKKTGTYQEKVPRWGLFGLAGYETKTRTYEYEEAKPLPTFEGKMPEAPAAPTAPTIEKFDTTKFDQRRAQLQSELQREVGERRSGRLAAVSRRSSRPMLQGS